MQTKIKIAIIAVIVVLAGILVFFFFRGRQEQNSYEELFEEAVVTEPVETEKETEEETPEETQAPEPEKPSIGYESEVTFDYDYLYGVNSDYAGWLYIPNTEISYPVVLCHSNDYYLHRAFEDESYAYAGTLFIDGYSEKGIDQDNLIIYGHNMKNGSMFGTLKQFQDTSFFESHPYIEFHTEDEKRIYEIFSVREVSSDITSLNFALDGFTVEEYVSSAKEESVQFRDVSSDWQIITLSTCVGDYDYRLLVSALRVQ